MTSAPNLDAGNRYTVVVRDEAAGQGMGQGTGQEKGWIVTILDPDGREVSERACRDETEAITFASTVRQHAGWLSEGRFREIYRIPEGA
ncbi:MAG TPA: hypothetical protein VF195_00485 [Actinomycetota bacterium]